MIEFLKPVFKGPLAAYGEGVACRATLPPGTVYLLEWLNSPSAVADLLCRRADLMRVADLRPVASAWMLTYTVLLLPPVVAAATLFGRVFPVAAREVAIELDSQGLPRTVIIPHLGSNAAGQHAAERYMPLIDAHLTPLITRLSEVSHLPAKILWGNVARRLDAILDQASAVSPAAGTAAQLEADRDYLLRQRIWRPGRRNPMFGRQLSVLQRFADGRQAHTRLHRQCCLYYLLPGKGYCAACPLSPQFQLGKSKHLVSD